MSKLVYAAEEREKVQAIPVWQEISFDGHETVMMGYNIGSYTFYCPHCGECLERQNTK